MEYKKKTIIWEDNNEPPKDYIWAKNDGKFYEYSHAQRKWIESNLISSGSGEEQDVMSIIKEAFREVVKEDIYYTNLDEFNPFYGMSEEDVVYPDLYIIEEYSEDTNKYVMKQLKDIKELIAEMSYNGSEHILPMYLEEPTDTEKIYLSRRLYFYKLSEEIVANSVEVENIHGYIVSEPMETNNR